MRNKFQIDTPEEHSSYFQEKFCCYNHDREVGGFTSGQGAGISTLQYPSEGDSHLLSNTFSRTHFQRKHMVRENFS
ncbi:hypothetical protein SRHO_G00234870 [Serrasalmus rhombeus]